MSDKDYAAMFKTTITCVIVTGLLAAMCGALVVADYADHIGQLSSTSRAITSVMEKVLLITGEIILVIVFSCFGIFMMSLLDNLKLLKKVSVLVITLKVIFALLLYLPFYRTWYFILDPNGSHGGVFFVIALSSLQFFTLVILNNSFRSYKGE